MQPGAELSICNRQRFVLNNVFGYLAKRERHGGEDENTRHEVQTQEIFYGKLLHGSQFRSLRLIRSVPPRGSGWVCTSNSASLTPVSRRHARGQAGLLSYFRSWPSRLT